MTDESAIGAHDESLNNSETTATDRSITGFSTAWKLVIGLVAVVIIGVLAFPLFQSQQAPPQNQQPQELSSDSPETLFEQGNDFYQAGQLNEAIAAYQKAIQLNPNYQEAYANLGVVYYQQQQYDLAASQYEKALELNPNDGDVSYNLSVLYLQQALQSEQPNPELLDKAVTQLENVMELSPTLAEPHFSLGVAYLALNQPENAIAAFETYLSFDNLDPRAKQEAERYLSLLHQQ